MKTIVRKWWDIWSAGLLIAALMIVATRLVETEWTKHLDTIQYLTLLGAITGIALGVSRYSPRLVKLMGLVFTIFAIPWMLGVVLSPNVQWQERILGLYGRLLIAGRQFLASQPVVDPILFLLLMSVLFWLVSLTAGYYLTRYASAWGTILPAGLVLIIINHYDRFQPGMLRLVGIYLFLALLLLGRLTFLRNKVEWQANGIFLPPETSVDLGRASLVVGAVLVVFAFAVPLKVASEATVNDFWSNISRPWDDFRDRFSDAFSSLRATVGEEQEFYGDQLALGSSTSLTDKLLFYVYPSELPDAGVRYYWRARSYDQYFDGEWRTSFFEEQDFDANNFALQYPSLRGRKIVEFTFSPTISQQKTLFTPAMPLWVSRPGTAVIETMPDGTVDPVVLTARPSIRNGEFYRVRSWVSNPTVLQLRMVKQEYPEWATEKYLTVPANISPRVKALAEEITANLDNPYDKADAITNWLRSNITYSEEIPSLPPNGTDPVDWFLFTIKEGYCNYYATAEIIMLRSLGIPARMSVGYAQGQWDDENEVYTVRQRESHAWPEVYFPGYGWIEFEPTVSQPARVIPMGEVSDQVDEPSPGSPQATAPDPRDLTVEMDEFDTDPAVLAAREASTRRQMIMLGVLIASMALVAVLYLRFAHPRLQKTPLPLMIENGLRKRGINVPRWLHSWRARALRSPFDKAYAAIERAIRLLGRKVMAAQTPLERASALQVMLPESSAQVNELVDQYQRAQYSPYPADIDRARLAGRDITIMAYKAFFRRLFTNRA